MIKIEIKRCDNGQDHKFRVVFNFGNDTEKTFEGMNIKHVLKYIKNKYNVKIYNYNKYFINNVLYVHYVDMSTIDNEIQGCNDICRYLPPLQAYGYKQQANTLEHLKYVQEISEVQ